MHEAETRALRRAAVLLLVVSVARWGWSARPSATPADAGTSVLGELLEASRDAADEESRRSKPLAEGERIDPNRASALELDRLPGIGPSAAGAIVAAREAGEVFRSPDDLLSVRGIGPATLERIRSAIDVSRAPPPARPTMARAERAPGGDDRAIPVDLNRADLEELQTLPGIGPAIAERILVARREQVFTSVEDLVRVRGIGPATVERLRRHVTVASGP